MTQRGDEHMQGMKNGTEDSRDTIQVSKEEPTGAKKDPREPNQYSKDQSADAKLRSLTLPEKDLVEGYLRGVWEAAKEIVDEEIADGATGPLGTVLQQGDSRSQRSAELTTAGLPAFLAEIAENTHLVPPGVGATAEPGELQRGEAVGPTEKGMAPAETPIDEGFLSPGARLLRLRTHLFSSNTPAQILRLLREEIAEALIQLRDLVAAPRDQQVDLVILALRRLPHPWILGTVGLLPDAAGYLLRGRTTDELLPDELSTLAAIGDLIPAEGGVQAGGSSVYAPYFGGHYYHRVVAACVRSASSGGSLSEQHRNILGINLNNLIVESERILREHRVPEPALGQLRAVERRLLYIGVHFGREQAELAHSEEQLVTVLKPLMDALKPPDSTYSLDPTAVARTVFPLVSVGTVMRPTNTAPADVREAIECVLTLTGALVTSVLAREHLAGSRYFNAAVCLLRASRSAELARVRMVLNGMGLWWALRLGRGVKDALTSGDGTDCAVNLFGAAVDLVRGEQMEYGPLLQELLSAVLAWVNGPLRLPDHRARLMQSAERLRLDAVPLAKPSPEALQAAITKLLNAFCGSAPPTTSLAEAATWSGATAAELVGNHFGDDYRRPAFEHLSELAREAAAAIESPVATLRRVLEPALKADDNIEPGILLTYLVEDWDGKRAIRELWNKTWHQAIRPCDDLARVIREVTDPLVAQSV